MLAPPSSNEGWNRNAFAFLLIVYYEPPFSRDHFVSHRLQLAEHEHARASLEFYPYNSRDETSKSDQSNDEKYILSIDRASSPSFQISAKWQTRNVSSVNAHRTTNKLQQGMLGSKKTSREKERKIKRNCNNLSSGEGKKTENRSVVPDSTYIYLERAVFLSKFRWINRKFSLVRALATMRRRS